MGIREQILQMAEQKGYREGLREARLERDTIYVENLLRLTEFTNQKIADLVEVSIEFVKEIRAKLK